MRVNKTPMLSEYCGIWTMDFKPRGNTIRELIKIASNIYGIPESNIVGLRGTKRVTRARHYVCYHAYEQTHLSLTQIGRVLNRDHTTILYGHFAHAYRHNLPRSCGSNLRTVWKRSLSYEGPEPTEPPQ